MKPDPEAFFSASGRATSCGGREDDLGVGAGEALRSGVPPSCCCCCSPSPVSTCFSLVTRRLSMMLLSLDSLLLKHIHRYIYMKAETHTQVHLHEG